MFKTTLFILPLAASAASGSVTPNSLFEWLGIAAFLMVLANQGAVFWKNFFKQEPASAEVAKDLERLSKTLTDGLDNVESKLEERYTRYETSTKERLDKVEDDVKEAKRSRSGIHKENDIQRERSAKLEVEVENIKQRLALNEMKG